ncbi:MAG: 3-methyl-2-oxobutanoate hydroxymethyltransferase [Deltaproteobacteria bacterium]
MSAEITVPGIRESKGTPHRLTMVTAYDCTFARLIDRADVDILLVGDSLGMVVQGGDSTVTVTMDEMEYHVRMVARAKTNALVLGDMPWLSYHLSKSETVANAGRLIQAGAQAVKLEGGCKVAKMIKALVRAEIPVVGHVGLTPQAVNRMGGHKVQGRDDASRAEVLADARAVEKAGAFAIVLEGVPLDLAREITEALSIPTIGIGAGPFCDGQVLVMHDLLGLDTGGHKPRFVRSFANLGQQVTEAVSAYREEVHSGSFPNDAESYHTAGSEQRAGEGLQTITSVAGMRAWADRTRAAGLKISLVPTMGYLHEGHLSLVREAKKRGDRVVVSIFVNPIQFDHEEDLTSYPREMERDCTLLAAEGVDLVFAPAAQDMYAENFSSLVDVEKLTDGLCGSKRPGHFRGVATVVTKLFHCVQPHFAVFGEKDYQQLAVVRRMARDLDFGVEIIGGAVAREADGLAMSSRNARLSSEGRRTAVCVPRALDTVRLAVAGGQRSTAELKLILAKSFSRYADVRLEYGEVVCPDSLEPLARVQGPVQFAVAIWLDGVRLIDNIRIDPQEAAPALLATAEKPATLSGYEFARPSPWLADRSGG